MSCNILSPKLDIVAISDYRVDQTISSLYRSFKLFPNSSFYLFTSCPSSYTVPDDFQESLNFIEIPPIISLASYSNFVIYDLHRYLSNTHCLIVQWDGMISFPPMWTDSFLDYDYIGAPFIPRPKDPSYSTDLSGTFYAVGNGGFSLRSLKLLQSASLYNLKDNYDYTRGHEDGFFCVYHRQFLESKGFTWAPLELARLFSKEKPSSLNELFQPSFGVHGKLYCLVSHFWYRLYLIMSLFNDFIFKLLHVKY